MIEFTTVSAPCEGSITEKRSEFIAQLFPAQSEEICRSIIEDVKAKHHKARHNVWAYILRDGGVTRYFGGVLLGAPGLTRAYSSAAAEAVQNAELLHFRESFRIRLETDYSYYGTLSHMLPEYGIKDAGSDFSDKVTLLFDIPAADYPALEARLTELYNGKPALEQLETHFVSY